MVQHIEDSLAANEVAHGVDPPQQPRQRIGIAHVGTRRHDEQVFVEHHLSRAPQRLGDFHGLPLVTAVDRNDGDVVGRTDFGHRQVADFGLQGHADRSEKDPLRRAGDPCVLLRRNADDRSRINRIASAGQGRDMEKRIAVFERIEARMVPERPLDRLLFGRIDIALDHEVAVGRNIDIVGNALHEFHRTAAQEPGQQVFVHVVRHRSRRGVGIDGIAAQRDRNGHPAAQTLVGVVMARSGLVNMPVHTRRTVVEDLHAVHADVAHARFGIDRIDHRQGHEAASVRRPAFEDRKRGERRLGPGQHDLLACAPARHGPGKPARHLGQHRQGAQFV